MRPTSKRRPMEHFKGCVGLGIAGNFALHLEQAGESEDFKDLDVADEQGPRGIFPFYVPGRRTQIGVFPLSANTLMLPMDQSLNVQAEPEVALECTLSYSDGKVAAILPERFAPYNDASIRRPGAKKISEKKNWGAGTKGLGEKMLAIDTFSSGGIMDDWHIASFLRRGDVLHRYGEDAALTGYSYFHETLTDWIIRQLNTQRDTGPLEPVLSYLASAGFPEKLIISIGATRYTAYGEKTFLEAGDECIVVLYDRKQCDPDTVMQSIAARVYDTAAMSVLVQKVVHA